MSAQSVSVMSNFGQAQEDTPISNVIHLTSREDPVVAGPQPEIEKPLSFPVHILPYAQWIPIKTVLAITAGLPVADPHKVYDVVRYVLSEPEMSRHEVHKYMWYAAIKIMQQHPVLCGITFPKKGITDPELMERCIANWCPVLPEEIAVRHVPNKLKQIRARIAASCIPTP